MKNNKDIDNKTVKEIEKFINEEIWASKIWIFSGILITTLLCMILKDYMTFELDNIIFSLGKLKFPDIKSVFFMLLFILEVLLSLILPKIIINKSKKNMKSGLILISLLTGLILALFLNRFLFFVTQKTIIAIIMLVLALMLIVFLIKMDIKNIKVKILKQVENNDTEILEKIRFFSAITLYSDVIKVVNLYFLMILIIYSNLFKIELLKII